jgi:dipeptidyl aminopeptidase/acylaminoacyl peptidase
MSARLLATLTLLTASAAVADSHPFAVEDLVALRRVAEPRPSPDGSRVAFTLSTVDLDANKRRVDLWLVNADGTGLRQLTYSAESEASPRWSPDGKSLLFLAKRGAETTQVWRLPLDGGEASAVTRLPLDVDTFAVSADGQRLVVSMEVFPDCPDLACTKKRTAEKPAATGRLYRELLFRHWDEWEDGRRAHLFAVTVADGGDAVDLMKGMEVDCPTKPMGGDEDYTFTPDGKAVVFSAKDEGRASAWSTNLDLFLAPLDGSKAPARLTAANRASDVGPAFSPDGKQLAYRAMSKPGYESDRFRIMVRAWPSGAEREVAPRWDRSPGELAWSPDGKTLYAVAEDLGRQSLFAVDVVTGAVREVVRGGWVTAASAAKGRVFLSREDLRAPADVFSVKPDGTGLTHLTRMNAELLTQIRFGQPEPFEFKGWNGETVHGWLVKPADFDPGKKWPVAFLVHGGPQGSFGDDFHYRWNPQTYAGAGYAAVMVDFHGSTGYGQAFTDAIGGDWGGKPLEDLQKGLAAALQKYPFLDGDRVAALGASFGGYMVNWIAGAWPDRFRCLVSHDGNLDEQVAYFDTEELWFPEREHGGTPWENPTEYQKHNPVNLVKNWKTPILVIHGAKDFRVVETQGMATFTAAQRRGIPSELLYFPDENHWVLKPQNSILWHHTVLGWLDRWTKAPATAAK